MADLPGMKIFCHLKSQRAIFWLESALSPRLMVWTLNPRFMSLLWRRLQEVEVCHHRSPWRMYLLLFGSGSSIIIGAFTSASRALASFPHYYGLKRKENNENLTCLLSSSHLFEAKSQYVTQLVWTCGIDQAGLEFRLPVPPVCWD